MPLAIGDRVRLKASVTKPRYGWGSVSRGDIGTVASLAPPENDKCTVDFDRQAGWSAQVSQLEPAEMAFSAVYKGNGVTLSADHLLVSGARGWARATHGVPRDVVYRWTVQLSAEDGGRVHFVGVMTGAFDAWSDFNCPQHAYYVQNNAVYLSGRLDGDGRPQRFQEGDLVEVEVDRSNGCSYLRTTVDGQQTAEAALPHDVVAFYPAVAIVGDGQTYHAIFTEEPRLVFP